MALLLALGLGLLVAPAEARIEPAAVCDPGQAAEGYFCFHPYATSYTYVDDRYALPADRIQGRSYQPAVVRRPVVRAKRSRPLMRPRVSFARKLRASTEAL